MTSDDKWLHSTRPAPRAEYGIMCKDPRPGCWSKHYHRIVPRDIADVIWTVEAAGLGKTALAGGWYRDLSAVEHPGDHIDVDMVITDPDDDALEAFLAEFDEDVTKCRSDRRVVTIAGIVVDLHLVVSRG